MVASIRKALAPAVLGIAGTLTDWIASGHLDVAGLRIALAGAVTAIVVWLVPNAPGKDS